MRVTNCLFINLYVCLTAWTTSSQQTDLEEEPGGTRWASAEEEALDEINDTKLYQAVLQSVQDWQAKHNRTSRRWKREEGGAPPPDAISSICYPEVGCFSDSGYLDMLPSPPEVVQTRFLVYSSSRGGPRRRDIPLLDVAFTNMSAIDEWATKTFNMSLPTKVIVHGFGSSCSHVWVYEMRSALMSVEKCNVLCVDWESGATFPNYVRAAANTRLVGRQLSLLLSSLRDKHGLDPATVHIIGFSLGAHAAAFAGAHLGNVKRITGLDPAGPLFESAQPSLRLDPSDAAYVDVIHSNGEALILGGLGSFQPMGHVDFYPNGGRMQNGCSNLFVGAFTDILWSGAAIEGRSLCNHRRAYKFFTDSVSPKCLFPAVPCRSYEAYLAGECFPCKQGSSCPSMGYYADKTEARGTLYLVTRDEEPFCAHQYLVQVWSSKSALPVISYGKIQLTLLSQSQINETFTLTQKDDEELAVGGVLSRIIVPHPAMEDFTSVALLYTAYTGWISSGLAKWSIDKILLTDSLGKQMSMCEKDLVMESGSAIVIQLQPGDCGGGLFPPTYNTTNTTFLPPSHLYNGSDIDRFDSGRFNITQVVYIGDETISNSTTEQSFSNRISLEWEPILEVPERSGHSGNDLESSGSEDVGRGFRDNGTIGRSLRKDKTKTRKKHYKYVNGTYQKVYDYTDDSSSNDTSTNNSTNDEIIEPVLKATTPKFRYIEDRWYPDAGLTPPALGATESWKHWEENTLKRGKNLNIEHQESNDSVLRSFTIQLLPSRLAQLLEQAEKYARLALAPFRFTDEGRARRFNFTLPSLLSWAYFRTDDNSSRTESTTFSYGFTETEISIDEYATPSNIPNDTMSNFDYNSTSVENNPTIS